MKAMDLDAIICGSPTGILLLSGYWPVMGATLALFSADGDVHAILPYDEVEIAERTSSAAVTPYQPLWRMRPVAAASAASWM